MKHPRRVLAFLIPAGAMFLFGANASADIDPASDVLLQQNVFLPYQPKVCSQLEEPLTKLTDQAAREGYSIKVAIIGSQADLGGAAQYFGEPQRYAEFLGSELGISRHGDVGVQTDRSLLTVMPDGFGFHRSGKASDVAEVVDGLGAPEGGHPNDLARATIAALPKLARAAGHPVPVPSVRSGCPGSGGSSAIVFMVPIALILLAAAIIGLAARRRTSGET
jgi:hypothetical protein